MSGLSRMGPQKVRTMYRSPLTDLISFTDGKPAGNFQNNDYRPDPTGGRADRIRGASENGSVKNGLPRPGAGVTNSPAHSSNLQVLILDCLTLKLAKCYTKGTFNKGQTSFLAVRKPW